MLYGVSSLACYLSHHEASYRANDTILSEGRKLCCMQTGNCLAICNSCRIRDFGVQWRGCDNACLETYWRVVAYGPLLQMPCMIP